jgi:hypothetical protein
MCDACIRSVSIYLPALAARLPACHAPICPACPAVRNARSLAPHPHPPKPTITQNKYNLTPPFTTKPCPAGVYIEAGPERDELTTALHSEGYSPVYLDQKTCDLHYNGFCNSVLWQLFHYVPLNIGGCSCGGWLGCCMYGSVGKDVWCYGRCGSSSTTCP